MMSLRSYLMGHEVYLFISGTFTFERIKPNLRNSYHRFCWKEKVCLGLSLQKTVCEKSSAKYGF